MLLKKKKKKKKKDQQIVSKQTNKQQVKSSNINPIKDGDDGDAGPHPHR